MKGRELLQGAIDIHLHATPDVVPRAADALEVARSAVDAGMRGLVLKDHCTSTVGRVSLLRKTLGEGLGLFSTLALNPPVGGINVTAVEAALRAGVDVVVFPTYGAANHVRRWGKGKPPTEFPFPRDPGFEGYEIVGHGGEPTKECREILELLALYDAVLATGHLSPEESLLLLEAARMQGVRRLVVNHATESVTPWTIPQQRKALALGAFVEHSFFACTPLCPGAITHKRLAEVIQATGTGGVILSSDFGQVQNGPPVEAFARHLEAMLAQGVPASELRRMVSDNPARLLEGREDTTPGRP